MALCASTADESTLCLLKSPKRSSQQHPGSPSRHLLVPEALRRCTCVSLQLALCSQLLFYYSLGSCAYAIVVTDGPFAYLVEGGWTGGRARLPLHERCSGASAVIGVHRAMDRKRRARSDSPFLSTVYSVRRRPPSSDSTAIFFHASPLTPIAKKSRRHPTCEPVGGEKAADCRPLGNWRIY